MREPPRPVEYLDRCDLLNHIRRQDKIIAALLRVITGRSPDAPPRLSDPAGNLDPTVRTAMEKNGNNIAAAARELGVKYQTLYQKIRRHSP